MKAEWQPIGTHPTDEDVQFLVYTNDGDYYLVTLFDEDNFWNYDVLIPISECVYWVPLPDPPK